jgi:hypothetical protein
MKKLILTLFLASVSLVSFAQSTVKTIRIALPSDAFIENIPQGTQVVLLSNNIMYTAAVGIASGTVISAAITANSLVTVGTVYSVTDESEVTSTDQTNGQIVIPNSQTPDGAIATIANTDFKVYLNGTLLVQSAYTYVSGVGITIAGLCKFDQVSVVYNSIK